MATISFYAGADFVINNASASGLGFYGDGFGSSIPVGEYNSRTFITNSNGTVEGPEVDNIKYVHLNSGIIGQTGSPINVLAIPNYLATANVRFEHTSSVRVINAEARIFDRTSINSGPSGVTCKVIEIIHPDTGQVVNGSGDSGWINASGSGTTVPLANSPGTSGLSPSGSATVDTRHDWFLGISASPDSVGSKTAFGLYVSCEYL